MVRKLLLILLLILLPCSAWAGTSYYISAAGSGETCSSESPCALATAVAAAGSGDTIYFKSDDTWTGQATILTAVAGVTYDGSTYGSGTRAKLQATSSAGDAHAIIRVGVSNVSIKGFELDGGDERIAGIQIGGYAGAVDIADILIDNCLIYNIGTGVGSNASWSSGIDMSPRNDGGTNPHRLDRITVKNTTIHDTVRNGIAVYPAWTDYDGNINSDILIRNCTIYNAGNNGGQGNAASGIGVHIKSDSRNVTVEYNTFHDNLNAGVYVESFYEDPLVAPTNMIVRYNLMYNNAGGIALVMNDVTASATGAFYGNIIYNSTSIDISVAPGGANNFNNSVLKFYNNTIYTTVAGSFGAISVDDGTTVMTGSPTIEFKNNIVYTTNRPALTNCWNDDDNTHTSYLTHSNNLYYRSSENTANHIILYKYGTREISYDRDGTASDLTNWEATAQKTPPAFTGGSLPTGFSGTYGSNMVPDTDYFQLTVDSPAKDAGATLASYTGAINGAGLTTPIVRPLGAAFDIGAYEYGTVAQSGGSAGSGFFLQGVTIR